MEAVGQGGCRDLLWASRVQRVAVCMTCEVQTNRDRQIFDSLQQVKRFNHIHAAIMKKRFQEGDQCLKRNQLCY